VVLSWFLFGKGQILGAAVGLKVLADTTNLAEKVQVPYLDWILLFACIGAAVFAATSQPSSSSANIERSMQLARDQGKFK
jgi:hypothetical protein